MRVWLWLVVCCGCSGAQSGDRGPTFCKSYEDQYLVACQQHCESQYPEGDIEAAKSCQGTCLDDLRSDDEYASSCPEQRKQLTK